MSNIVSQSVIDSVQHACSAILYKNGYHRNERYPVERNGGARFVLTQNSDWTKSSMMIAEAEANKDMEDDHRGTSRCCEEVGVNYPLAITLRAPSHMPKT
jgi:hypothetical protein